ncbi:nucleoside hydrolase [Kineococcus sp. R8]|uniref:nucleoside hydrolase n=1 Tax=Kineococcus siccus TaxID=2696567 RepID=UPI001411C988|nr:nucleoside hydrolase [Kineococcus siccus]NAZ80560.1 nucleoside hydrolase [Kineococcus siccus]
MDSTPFFLDCDTGIDDSLALAYLVATPGVDLVGVGAVSGNLSAAGGARNTSDLLHLLGRPEVPVAVGAHDPLSHPFAGGAPHVHGRNGIGDVQLATSPTPLRGESAAEMLVRLAREHEGRLRVLAIGPFTNLALALRLEPELPRLVRDVTVMGGAALAPGNVSPVAEANVANDPEAAHAVFSAGWDLTMVGLDVTMQHRFEERHREALLAAGTPATTALARMLEFYFAFYTPIFGRPSAALHDPLAVAVAAGGATPTSAPRVPVVVDHTDGPGRGQTIADLRALYTGFAEERRGGARVVLSIAEDFGDVLLDRLLTL